MRVIVKPFPVLYACQGCPEFGQIAREAGALLDRAGFAEMIWLGASRNSKPTQRFPVFALDGCAKGCAQHWLEDHAVAAQRSFVFADHGPGAAERAAQAITHGQG